MLDTGYRLPKPRCCPQSIYEMMRQCWSQEASERPTFQDLCWQLESFIENDISANNCDNAK